MKNKREKKKKELVTKDRTALKYRTIVRVVRVGVIGIAQLLTIAGLLYVAIFAFARRSSLKMQVSLDTAKQSNKLLLLAILKLFLVRPVRI